MNYSAEKFGVFQLVDTFQNEENLNNYKKVLKEKHWSRLFKVEFKVEKTENGFTLYIKFTKK